MTDAEQFVYDEDHYNGGSNRSHDLDERSSNVEQAHGWHKPRHETLPISFIEMPGRDRVTDTNQNSNNQKSCNDTQRSKIDVELHHLPDTNTGRALKLQAGVPANGVSTTGDYRLLWPQDSRDQSQCRLIKRSTICKIGLSGINRADNTPNQIILIQAFIDESQMPRILKINEFEIRQSRSQRVDAVGQFRSAPDLFPDGATVAEVRYIKRQAEEDQ